MAVRRKKVAGGEGASLDSLMDALTNVVAVLIFVLLLVNCDVSQKVVKIMEDIVPVSEEQVQQVKEMLKQLEIDAKRLEELRKMPQPSAIEFDQLEKEIEALKKLKDEKSSKIDAQQAAISELQRHHEEAKLARDVEQEKNVAMQEEIRRLEILLDTTPVEKDIPPTDITIPEPRVIPEGAKIYYAYVLNDRVHLVDPNAAMELAVKKFESLKTDKNYLAPKEDKKSEEDEGEDQKRKTAAEKKAERQKEKPVVFDREKILPVIKELDYKLPPGQKMEIDTKPWLNCAFLNITFKNAGGATTEELKQPTNGFISALSRIRPPNEVLIFRVAPNSMLTYALAREIADKKKIPCGWEFIGPETGHWHTYYAERIKGLVIKPTATPPPPSGKPAPERARVTGPKLD